MCLNAFDRWIKSYEETHWVNHIFDETVSWPNKALMWCNVHGFEESFEDIGQVYWIGMDFRSFGIRVADYVIRCKNKRTYDKWINKARNDMDNLLSAMKSAPELNVYNGDDVNVEYVFRWGDEDKSFNLHLRTDWYAAEK